MQIEDQQIVEKIRILLPKERDEVLRYVERILSKRGREKTLG